MNNVLCSPRELLEICLSKEGRSELIDPSLICARFKSGLILSVLRETTVERSCFLPEFNRVWWRQPFRWARGFQHLLDLADEVKALGHRRASPLFAVAASSFPKWSAIYDGRSADLEEYFEVILPDNEVILDSTSRFLDKWLSTFQRCSPVDTSSSGPFDPKLLENALLVVPGQKPGADAEELAEAALHDINELSRVKWGGCKEQLPFPNLLEFLVLPALSGATKRRWQEVFDRRVELLCQAEKPEHYPSIQGLASRNEWERDFVHEVEVSQSRGGALIGMGRMEALHRLGLKLECRFPILATDPFDSCRELFNLA